MNRVGYTFEDELTYSREDVLAFAALTGDNNPIHIDEEYAKKTEYGRNIVHGNFVIATLSKDTGTKFPGPGTIVVHKDISFIRPVFIGEPYKYVYKISSIDYKTSTAVFKCFLKNRMGKICIRVISTLKNKEVFIDSRKK